MAMNINMSMKKLPPYVRTIIVSVPSILLIVLFIVLVYIPKNNEITKLKDTIGNLDKEIASSEVKANRLATLKIENTRLKARLIKLQEQLPEEKEVSGLLKQISDLGIKSGLKILLWRPDAKAPDPGGLYIRIPVRVEVLTGYHNLGNFFSYISRLPRIVNVSDIRLSNPAVREGILQVNATFTATTFSAVAAVQEPKKEKKP
ncbi:MAG: type 4a pilus biogenesis protein PilO [Nitrospirae bacterium]|nr:type 4a pilus biogenesis protein PilO [Nitrospirota bacterium]